MASHFSGVSALAVAWLWVGAVTQSHHVGEIFARFFPWLLLWGAWGCSGCLGWGVVGGCGLPGEELLDVCACLALLGYMHVLGQLPVVERKWGSESIPQWHPCIALWFAVGEQETDPVEGSLVYCLDFVATLVAHVGCAD